MKNKWLMMVLVAGMSLCGASTQANIDLKTWKNYANLAEQGAICASFSTLMEAQSLLNPCLLYTSPSPRDKRQSRMPSSA